MHCGDDQVQPADESLSMMKWLHYFQFLSCIVLAALSATAAPPSMDGMVLWLDAMDRSTLEVDSDDQVLAWHDRSPAGNHAVVHSAAKPPRFLQQGLNSRPVIEFAGLDIPKGVYAHNELEAAKAEAQEKEKALAFIYTDKSNN